MNRLIFIALLGWELQLVAQDQCEQGGALFTQGKVQEARGLLEKAVLQKATAFCWKSLGVVLASEAKYLEAERAFGQACRLDAREQDACYFWGRALYALDRFEESLSALVRAPQGVLGLWRISTARAQALEALGRNEAETEFQKALSQRNQDYSPLVEPDPRIGLASFLYRQGRAEEAVRLLEGAPNSYQKLASFHHQLGRLWSQQGAWEKAARSFERALELNPGRSETHGLLSRVYYRLGDAKRGEFHAAKSRAGSVTAR